MTAKNKLCFHFNCDALFEMPYVVTSYANSIRLCVASQPTSPLFTTNMNVTVQQLRGDVASDRCIAVFLRAMVLRRHGWPGFRLDGD